jgi:hypothetical protein
MSLDNGKKDISKEGGHFLWLNEITDYNVDCLVCGCGSKLKDEPQLR